MQNICNYLIFSLIYISYITLNSWNGTTKNALNFINFSIHESHEKSFVLFLFCPRNKLMFYATPRHCRGTGREVSWLQKTFAAPKEFKTAPAHQPRDWYATLIRSVKNANVKKIYLYFHIVWLLNFYFRWQCYS